MIDVYPIKVTKLFFRNYTYLVFDSETREGIIVDPAWDLNKIEEKLKEVDAIPKHILLTHSHVDHVNLVKPIVKRYGVQVWMSKIEIDFYNYRSPNLNAIEQFSPFALGAFQIIPYLTPGHSKGGVCYLISDSLLSGDTLFTEGCGMCFGGGSDPVELFHSLALLKRVIPLNTKVYPGHSYGKAPGKTFKYLLGNNIYLNFDRCDHFVQYRMRKNQHGFFNFK